MIPSYTGQDVEGDEEAKGAAATVLTRDAVKEKVKTLGAAPTTGNQMSQQDRNKTFAQRGLIDSPRMEAVGNVDIAGHQRRAEAGHPLRQSLRCCMLKRSNGADTAPDSQGLSIILHSVCLYVLHVLSEGLSEL